GALAWAQAHFDPAHGSFKPFLITALRRAYARLLQKSGRRRLPAFGAVAGRASSPFRRSRSRRLSDHLVVGGVPAEQLPLDRRELARVLVNRHQNRLRHGALPPWTAWRRTSETTGGVTPCVLERSFG